MPIAPIPEIIAELKAVQGKPADIGGYYLADSAKVKAVIWKSKGKIMFGGSDNSFTAVSTVQGFDHFRGEFEGDFGGNTIKGVTVINGDKGRESNETFFVDLFGPSSNALISTARGTGTIYNDDRR